MATGARAEAFNAYYSDAKAIYYILLQQHSHTLVDSTIGIDTMLMEQAIEMSIKFKNKCRKMYYQNDLDGENTL